MTQIHQLCTRKDQEKKFRVCFIFKDGPGRETKLGKCLKKNLELLKKRGVIVEFGVDCRQIAETSTKLSSRGGPSQYLKKFSRILFCFPRESTLKNGRALANQEFFKKFLLSASQYLDDDDEQSRIIILLNIAYDSYTGVAVDQWDEWQLDQAIKEVGFIRTESRIFDNSHFPQYQPRAEDGNPFVPGKRRGGGDNKSEHHDVTMETVTNNHSSAFPGALWHVLKKKPKREHTHANTKSALQGRFIRKIEETMVKNQTDNKYLKEKERTQSLIIPRKRTAVFNPEEKMPVIALEEKHDELQEPLQENIVPRKRTAVFNPEEKMPVTALEEKHDGMQEPLQEKPKEINELQEPLQEKPTEIKEKQIGTGTVTPNTKHRKRTAVFHTQEEKMPITVLEEKHDELQEPLQEKPKEIKEEQIGTGTVTPSTKHRKRTAVFHTQEEKMQLTALEEKHDELQEPLQEKPKEIELQEPLQEKPKEIQEKQIGTGTPTTSTTKHNQFTTKLTPQPVKESLPRTSQNSIFWTILNTPNTQPHTQHQSKVQASWIELYGGLDPEDLKDQNKDQDKLFEEKLDRLKEYKYDRVGEEGHCRGGTYKEPSRLVRGGLAAYMKNNWLWLCLATLATL